ncbi:hypothetical protein ACFPM0_08305 [Pseudonocardia sulfidoxydans]|uniref:hypothetical protein n=1 Tax=Pseudonocardia sulfidoxydans TaxID=54011 RepID=UPI0036171F24
MERPLRWSSRCGGGGRAREVEHGGPLPAPDRAGFPTGAIREMRPGSDPRQGSTQPVVREGRPDRPVHTPRSPDRRRARPPPFGSDTLRCALHERIVQLSPTAPYSG